jgi:hypothetical protein
MKKFKCFPGKNQALCCKETGNEVFKLELLVDEVKLFKPTDAGSSLE